MLESECYYTTSGTATTVRLRTGCNLRSTEGNSPMLTLWMSLNGRSPVLIQPPECNVYLTAFWSYFADLSKNRLTEIPPEVCLFAPLESLNLYHNCIKCIPEAIINLQMLTYLDIRWVHGCGIKTFFIVWWIIYLFMIIQHSTKCHNNTDNSNGVPYICTVCIFMYAQLLWCLV